MKLVKAYNSVSLVLRIVIGMVIGTALALLIPNAAVTAPGIGILGKLFVGALKAIAPLLVFVLIISALAQSKEKMGKQFGTVIVLYLVSTFLAAAIAVVASYLFPVTITLTEAVSDSAPETFAEIFTNLLTNIVSNPIGSIVSGNFLGILFWAIVLGFAFKGAADSTKCFLADASEAVTKAVRFVINLAPFGILGLVFTAVSTSGLAIFTEYGKLLLLLVGCMLFSALVVNPVMAFVAMRNYITTTTTLTAELSEIRAKLALLERTDEDNAEAINDLSEDMRKELDNIYQAIAALSVKTPQARKQPRLIGYKTPEI